MNRIIVVQGGCYDSDLNDSIGHIRASLKNQPPQYVYAETGHYGAELMAAAIIDKFPVDIISHSSTDSYLTLEEKDKWQEEVDDMLSGNTDMLRKLMQVLASRADNILWHILRDMSGEDQTAILVMRYIQPCVLAVLHRIDAKDVSPASLEECNKGPFKPGDFYIIEYGGGEVRLTPGNSFPEEEPKV